MNERTTWYYNSIKKFRTQMRAIQADAEKELERLEPYKGSAGYEKDAAAIEEKRIAAVTAVQAETLNDIRSTIDGMRKKAKSVPILPPTAEQESILRLLKMRKSLTRDELDQAAHLLEGCPLALSVLREIAQDAGFMGYRGTDKASTEDILRSIASLEDFAAKTCKMPKVDNRKNWTLSPKYYDVDDQHSDFLKTDRDFSSEADCITWTGNVTDFEGFCAAVNG